MCECVVEHRSNNSDNIEEKKTWLRNASEHRVSECGELETVKCPLHANQEGIVFNEVGNR